MQLAGQLAVRPSTAPDPPTGSHKFEPSRLTPAYGLKTVEELKKLHHLDLKRTGASIALVRSMQMQTVKASGRPVTSPGRTGSSDNRGKSRRTGFDARGSLLMEEEELEIMSGGESPKSEPEPEHSRSSVLIEEVINAEHPSHPKSMATRRSKTMFWNNHIAKCMATFKPPEHIDIGNLEDAFYAISASFDMDGDGTLDSEELIHIFGRCHLFDEWLTPGKVRDYFKTAAQGCNYVLQEIEEGFLDGIDFEDFESVLRWSADMKGVEFADCVTRVVRLSRKLCDGRSSDRRKLETVFDAFCKTHGEYMTPYEFVNLCKKLDLCTDRKFTVADVYSIFYMQLNVGKEGMTFEEFMRMLGIVGQKLGVGDQVYSMFAAAVSKVDIDEPTIRKVKLRIKHAASEASDVGWRQFFHECDTDNSGAMDWDEFYEMCRERLHLTDRVNHLKILFEKLDTDDSGELSIDELIEFIEQASSTV